jgi:hypothetical protein
VTSPLDGAVPAQARGVNVLTQDEFSLASSVGGVRGVLEALAPGLVFVVVYLITFELTPTLVASLGVALLAVLVRLVQRTPVTQAFSGVAGVLIGVLWAWRSGDARDYFAFGLWTNGAYLAACLISVAVRWPLVGIVVEALRAGFGTGQTTTESPFAGFSRWRLDRALVRRYQIATVVWATLFAARLAVQLPLYLDDQTESIGWLGTARLVMGVPLWALTMWLTWVLVRQPSAAPAQTRPHPAP